MALYRLVVTMRAGIVAEPRGNPDTQMTFWVDTTTDEASLECAQRLADHLVGNTVDPQVTTYWCAYRGPEEVHTVTSERWGSVKRDYTVGKVRFALAELPVFDVEIPGVPLFSFSAGIAQPLNQSNRAMLVELVGATGRTRRCYIGPVSTIAVKVDVDFAVISPTQALFATGAPFTGLPSFIDVPNVGLPGVEFNASLWPDEYCRVWADWALGIDAAYGAYGNAVVKAGPSAQLVVNARASTVPARIVSRGVRGPMIDPA